MISAAALEPGKCAWYFNNHAHRCALSAAQASLLPSGTTSNEALHNELNVALRQTTNLHQATLATKLAVIHLGKLIVHVMAYLRMSGLLEALTEAQSLKQYERIANDLTNSLEACEEARDSACPFV